MTIAVDLGGKATKQANKIHFTDEKQLKLLYDESISTANFKM